MYALNTKHAVDVIISEKAANNRPASIAPIALVAGNVTASKITENRIVPRIPAMSVPITERALHGVSKRLNTDVINAIAR